MNEDVRLISAALDRRFARVEAPPCPEAAWTRTASPRATHRATQLHRFAYAAAMLLAVAATGLGGAQAANAIKEHYPKVFAAFVSTAPLKPIIHKADQLTVAQAQRRIAFPIVVPTGLPPNTTFLYAHVISESPAARVAMVYQAHINGKYYRLSFNESDAPLNGPAQARFELRGKRLGFHAKSGGSSGQVVTWTVPERRWKHGSVYMRLIRWGLPESVTDGIVRANTM